MPDIPTQFTITEIREGIAPLLESGVECMTCSRLLAYVKDSLDSVERLREAAKIALVSLKRLAQIDADDSGIDVELCEYKGTEELRDALAETDSSQGEEK